MIQNTTANLFSCSLCLSFSQFSDNGLVQFQSAAENEQYLLPAPLSSGFPNNMNVTLLAVFWDDADLTQGDGQLFYQVRCNHGSRAQGLSYLVIYWLYGATCALSFLFKEYHKLEEQKSKPAFTPAWILKITWDHVMPVSYQKINFSEVKK